jgi:hypothetical protein
VNENTTLSRGKRPTISFSIITPEGGVGENKNVCKCYGNEMLKITPFIFVLLETKSIAIVRTKYKQQTRRKVMGEKKNQWKYTAHALSYRGRTVIFL